MEAMAHDLSWDGECYDVHVEAYSAIKNLWSRSDMHVYIRSKDFYFNILREGRIVINKICVSSAPRTCKICAVIILDENKNPSSYNKKKGKMHFTPLKYSLCAL